MHPVLWKIPGIDYTIRTYGFCMGVGILLVLVLIVRRARREGLDPAAMTTVALIGVVLGMIGCRGMHFIHYYGKDLASGKLGLSNAVTMSGGGEILGGVILGFGGAIAYLHFTRRPILRYLELATPPLILAMALGRIGCFMFGCCYGGVCETADGRKALPWAVQFPYGSPAYVLEYKRGQLDVPDKLLWQPNKLLSAKFETEEPEIIPAEFLRRSNVDQSKALHEYVALREEYGPLRESQPNDPRTAEIKASMEALRPQLPGETKLEKVENSVLGVHLKRLSDETGKPTQLADLASLAENQHSRYVHPTQIYDAINLLLLFFLLTAIYNRSPGTGLTLACTMIAYPISRYLMEMIRDDNPKDVGGFTISQFISLLILVAGITYMIYVLRSARSRTPLAATAA